jgi:4-amino-4-deoxy-L-arabinose transferase-like glycosyltransferase
VIRRLALPFLLALCIGRMWVMPLGSSFWVDEAETAFIVHHGVNHPSLAIIAPAIGSVYYWLPRASEAVFGFSEAAERLPSVLTLALALVFIGRVAARLIHPEAAWFAVFACLTLRVFNYEAADARAYALGTCVAAASLWLLIRWLDSGRWIDGSLFLAAGALLWRVHLVYWPFYFVYVIYFLARSDRKASWVQVITISAGLVLALLPVSSSALAMSRDAAQHVFAPLPSWSELGETFKIRLVAGCALGGLLYARLRRAPRVDSVPAFSAIALIAGWWLVQPLGLFAYSHLSGVGVFTTRYVSIALPGAALAATAAVAFFVPASCWKWAALVMGIAALVFGGQWSKLWPSHHNSDWRGAARAVNALALGPSTPMLVVSPFVEAKPPVWSPDYALPGYLYSQLDVYPINGKPYLLPYGDSPAGRQYAEALARSMLPAAGRFLIHGPAADVARWREWFAARPEFVGWRTRQLGPFLDVDVALFAAP